MHDKNVNLCTEWPESPAKKNKSEVKQTKIGPFDNIKSIISSSPDGSDWQFIGFDNECVTLFSNSSSTPNHEQGPDGYFGPFNLIGSMTWVKNTYGQLISNDRTVTLSTNPLQSLQGSPAKLTQKHLDLLAATKIIGEKFH